ncbi:DUF2170 domain-containing protein, partial [Salmonella enterica]|nr:DUF2170 domain-containing protein [Salmonella enterica]EIS8386399.1 DUF2170 domain-containing protein [Salmonella enterica]
MAWTPRTLADALNNLAEIDIDIIN